MSFDPFRSVLEQVAAMRHEHPLSVWADAIDSPDPATGPQREAATLLLAVNYELLGYPPEHAWILARRGESAAPDPEGD